MEIIHYISALTHAHPISLISCGIYCLIAAELLEGKQIKKAINNGIEKAKNFYQQEQRCHE